LFEGVIIIHWLRQVVGMEHHWYQRLDTR
jgi:hypothetical protein